MTLYRKSLTSVFKQLSFTWISYTAIDKKLSCKLKDSANGNLRRHLNAIVDLLAAHHQN